MTLTYRCEHCGNEVEDDRMVDRSGLAGPLLKILDVFWRRERAAEVCRERGHLEDR